MAFDATGALWIAMSDRILSIAAAGTLTGEVTPVPLIVLTLSAAFPTS